MTDGYAVRDQVHGVGETRSYPVAGAVASIHDDPMALHHSKPNETLTRELREVARDAVALIDFLSHINVPLKDFPTDQLIDIARSLAQLPGGTAEGCRVPLEYARNRLPAIRREYILSEEPPPTGADAPPPVIRGTTLDQKMRDLITSVTTALDEYRKLAAEEIVDVVPEARVVPPEGSVREATVRSETLDLTLADAQETVEEVTRPDSNRADDLKRQLRDARGLNQVARAEIRMPRVVVSWLRKPVDALKDYPQLIRRTVKGLRVGTDVLEPLVERWHAFERNFSKFVISEWRKTLDAFEQIAETLDHQRRKGPGGGPTPLPKDFDLDEARRLILEGKAPPRSWWPLIHDLDFLGTKLHRLEPLVGLSNLQRLDLRGTKVSDVSALAGLSHLETLDLRDTSVTDVSSLAHLKQLYIISRGALKKG